MKAWKIAYWIVTVLLSAFIVASSVPDVLQVQGAITFIEHLGYPTYILLIVGWAKLLGVFGILQRWWPFLCEWAYAGLVIDTLGAFTSHLFVNDLPSLFAPALVALVLTLASYALLRKAYGSTARLAALS